MDEKQKKIAYIVAAVVVIIIVAVAAAKLSGSGNKATTNTTTTTETPVSTTTSTMTSTTTTTTTTSTPTTTVFTTTSTTTVTTTTLSQNTYEYIVPTTFSLPVTGSFNEEVVAYGLSVPKTTFTRGGDILYNGEDIVLMPSGADEITIMPMMISNVTTGAEIKVGDMYGTVPLQLLNFVRDAFVSPTLKGFAPADGVVTASYCTEILGEKAVGAYTYSNGAVILVMTFPYSYTLNGVVFNVTGTYTLTYTGVAGPTSAITQTITLTTTIVQTSIETITSTITG